MRTGPSWMLVLKALPLHWDMLEDLSDGVMYSGVMKNRASSFSETTHLP